MEGMTMEREQQENGVSRESATSSNPHNEATLLGLPREMRNEIYAYLLASGHLSILRASRQLSLEALELIYKEATFRLFVNSAQARHNVHPRVEVTGKIQTLQLIWHLADYDCQRNASEVMDFCGKQVETRMTCRVILKFGARRAALLNANDITALRSLRTFRHVVIETMDEDSMQAIPCSPFSILQCRILCMFSVLSEELRLALGPAEHRKDTGAHYLVFHPSRMSGNRFQELPQSTTAYSW